MADIPKVRSVMTPFPRWIDADESIDRAKAMMAELGVRHLPVKHRGQLFGIITSRDVERAQLLGIGLRSGEVSIHDVCVHEGAYVVEHDTPLDEVLAEMAARSIGSALVVSDGDLVGILTTVDVCTAFADSLRNQSA